MLPQRLLAALFRQQLLLILVASPPSDLEELRTANTAPRGFGATFDEAWHNMNPTLTDRMQRNDLA